MSRITSITHPENKGNNVTYTYADPTPAFRKYNQVARIVRIADPLPARHSGGK